MRFYLDSSVIIEVVLNPKEIFSSEVNGSQRYFTSRLSQVEVLRTITKLNPDLLSRAAQVISRIQFIEFSPRIIDSASTYPQEITLKSSDAIHMATAEEILDVDDLLITYDKQMVSNAKKLGIKVATSF